ncbi:MAG TPA: hypothetical protein VMT85_01550 [Thermoanaerobaculia bacterium]|nr:hypothetical protein [Thermoanaerobaculia bacterium]
MKHPFLVLIGASIGSLGLSTIAAASSAADVPRVHSYGLVDAGARLAAPVSDEGFLRVPKAGTNLLVNGSFEQNNGASSFTGWSEFNDRLDPLSDGDGGTIDAVSDWWVQTGTVSPLGFFQDIPPPSDGRFAALTEQNGPGLHILYQDVTIPPQGATLSCDLWLFSASDPAWIVPSPPSFDFREIVNQHARVDIVSTSTVTGLGGGVLRNLFQTSPNDPAFIAPFTLRADLSDFAGERIRLRFAEADTENYLLFAVDNCSIVAENVVDPDEPIFGEEIQIVPGSVEPMVPTVQYNPDGTKAVIWMQNGGDGTIICIQIIDENDQAVTSPLIVNSSGVINETPTVDVRPDGTYQIVWTRRDGSLIRDGDGRLAAAGGGGSSIVSRGFSPGGTGAGGEVVISNGGTDESNAPSAATDRNGETTVTWEDSGEVKGRVLGRNGNPKTGVFGISSALGAGAAKPVVAVSASGDIIACWRQSAGSQVGIVCRVLAITGAAVSDFILVDPTPNSRAPDVATDSFGNFIVVWEENGVEGRDIFGRRYSRNGSPQGPAVILNENTAGNQTLPKVSRTAGGDFVTVWQSDTTPANATRAPSAISVGGGTSIVSRGFNPEGEAETSDVVVSESDATSDPEIPDVDLDDQGTTTVTFERRRSNGDSDGIFRREVLLPQQPSVCEEDNRTLCLNGDRFRVRAEWENADGSDRGSAQAEELTDDTGYFYFFNPENVEVVVKSLDACAFADSFWVFAGGLTDVEVTLVVEDTASGQAISYFNPVGAYQPIRDTSAFGTCDKGAVRKDPEEIERMSVALRAELEALAAADLDELGRTREQAGSGGCFSTSTRLCLNGGRFAVEVDFDTGSDAGPAFRSTLTDETGYFTFFEPDNVEVVVKLLNACSFANRYWVFAAGLTDVEVTLTVTDTSSGQQRTYFNPNGSAFNPINDTSAFATCP